VLRKNSIKATTWDVSPGGTNINNATFEGRSREVLRAGTNFLIHPMGDMTFNPLAKPGSPDYGNLYIGIGDCAAGERPGPTHNLPQRLDALAGKIIRIGRWACPRRFNRFIQ
jgi:hypothetical protein